VRWRVLEVRVFVREMKSEKGFGFFVREMKSEKGVWVLQVS